MHGKVKSDLEREMLASAEPGVFPTFRPMPAYWTPQEIRDLKWLYGKGLTFGQIARRMGRPRSSVAGKVFRLRRDGLL